VSSSPASRVFSTFFPPLFVLIASAGCFAQVDDVLCRDGTGNFEGEFQGQRVHVGAARSGGLAARSCEASLRRGEQPTVVVTGVSEVDLDAFATNLGFGVPVAAFQIKKSDSDCCRSYEIYSLGKEPQLLRTLTGGSFFRASDADLDARVEIWTDDAAAINQLENLSLSEFDFTPAVVLRFERNQLMDVSSEFQSYFDQQISEQRAKLEPSNLKDFKISDGRLVPDLAIPPDRMHRLRKTKIAILEITWSYLNSGREQKAWATLTDLWPEKDAERIRAEIVKARARGIRAQVDSTGTVVRKHKKRTTIYDATVGDRESEVIPPRGISMWRPPTLSAEQSIGGGDTSLDLVIDSAGKVRSVDVAGGGKNVDPELINAALQWTFIPALRNGHPVACRTRLAISTRR
jgi:hypothetical protein